MSNKEFLEFVSDQGYSKQQFWTEEGWQWRCFKNAAWPLFWRQRNGEFWLRLVAQEIPMPWSWPVEVNQLEAKAFCNWKSSQLKKSCRLLTEEEWAVLAKVSGIPDQLDQKCAPGNIGLQHFSSPCPVDKF